MDAGQSTEEVDTTSKAPARPASPVRSAMEWVAIITISIVVAMLIKTFVLQTFWIPSLSMAPTLQKDDRVVVEQVGYHFHDVGRGDVVVFHRPETWRTTTDDDLIKRVIGLPGERVAVTDGHVTIDGQQLDEPWLPQGVTTENGGRCTPTDPCVVPEGEVLVMGDNRGNSSDSRFNGPVPQSLIVGRAFVLLWPFGHFSGL